VQILVAEALADALEAKAAFPDAAPIAGGTDLMVAINAGRERPSAILDLSRVAELKTFERGGELLLGAGLTYARILRELGDERALVQAARSVGSPQIRNRGTVGGNVATASPAGDLLPVIAAFDGHVELAAAGGKHRLVPWDAFFVGPKRTSIEPDELITGVRWTHSKGHGVFAKVGLRNAMVISIVGICLRVDEAARAVRIALGSVAPTVVRATEAERFADGVLEEAGAWGDPGRVLPDAAVARFAELAVAAASPIDDVRGSAAYRRHAIGVLAARALRWALEDRRVGGI
jgi:CO/xanthine dehydrogenase FAD-binding subunit